MVQAEDQIAWVDRTKRYAAKVVMDDDGLPDSTCTCQYEWDCKHGVAVVIEYLKQIEGDQPIPKAKQGDARLKLVEDDDWDDQAFLGGLVSPNFDMRELAITAYFLINRVVEHDGKPPVLRPYHRTRYAGLFIECQHREAKADPLTICDRSPADNVDTACAHVADQVPICS